MPNVLSPSDLGSRPYNMDETVLSTSLNLDTNSWAVKFGRKKLFEVYDIDNPVY